MQNTVYKTRQSKPSARFSETSFLSVLYSKYSIVCLHSGTKQSPLHPIPQLLMTTHACFSLAGGHTGNAGVDMSLSSLACGEASEASVRSSRSCRHGSAWHPGPLQRHVLLLRRLHGSTFLLKVHTSPNHTQPSSTQPAGCCTGAACSNCLTCRVHCERNKILLVV